jgi:peroxiredoxin
VLSGPEQQARVRIDACLEAAGGVVQDRDVVNLSARRGAHLLFYPGRDTGYCVLEARIPRERHAND